MNYYFTIEGVAREIQEGWSITETINGRSTLTCAILSKYGTYRPAIGDEVVFVENGTRIFGGFVNTPSEQGIGKGKAIVTQFSAVDYNSLADRRFVQNGGFPAGWTLGAALDSLVGYLTPYGVSVAPDFAGTKEQFFSQQAEFYRYLPEGHPWLLTWFYNSTLISYGATMASFTTNLQAIISGMAVDEHAAFDAGYTTAVAQGFAGSSTQFLIQQAEYYRWVDGSDPRLLTFFYAGTLASYNALWGTSISPALTAIIGGMAGDESAALTAGWNAALVFGQVSGAVLPLLEYDIRSITSILDELSVITGYVWEIDYYKSLRMFAIGSRVAPFNPTSTDRLLIGDVTVESQREGYANRIIVQAGTGTSEVTDTFIGNGVTTAFPLTYTLSTHRGYVTNGAANETLGSGATWTYSAGVITRSSAPANLSAISITYIAQFPFNAVADGGALPADLVERIVTAPDIFSATVAQALAAGYLARAMDVSETVRYQTRHLGLNPGQTQTITIPERNLSGAFLITDVQTDNPGGSIVTRSVTATGGSQYHGSWRDDFKNGFSSGSGTTVGGTITINTGGGSAGTGTIGKLPKWATTTTLSDSIFSESGSVGTVAGSLVATSFTGSGSGLTALPAGQLTGTITPATQDLITRTGTLVSGATGVGYTLALSASTVTGNLPYANMPAGIGTWTATPTITGALTVNSQISVNANITTPALTNLTLNPTGDLMFDPSGDDVLPVTNYTLNVGLPQQKFLTLCAAELIVENLVAADVRSTVGGRIIVAPTTELVVDLASGGTTITTRHNNLSVGDILHLESRGQVEFMLVTASTGSALVPWLASGTLSLLFAPVVMITAYTYTVTRNLDGSGANNWIAGDGVVNTRTTGKGFIDLYAASGILSGVGPTIVGNVRTGTTYSNIEPRWAIGNLNGTYGVGTDIYGVGMGEYHWNGSAWVGTNITIDATNGYRARYGNTVKISMDNAGNAEFTGKITAGTGQIGGWSIGSVNLFLDSGTDATSAGMDTRDWAFYAGHQSGTRSTAPFRVSLAGALVATSADITGTLTSSSGTIGTFVISSTSLESGSVHLVGAGQIVLGSTISGTTNLWMSKVSGAPHLLWIGDSTASTVGFFLNGDGAMLAGAGAVIASPTDGVLQVEYSGGVAGAKTMILFTKSGATQGSITSNTANTQYNTSSDERLKKNIRKTRYGLRDLMKINVRDFEMIDDPNDTEATGLIAQQLRPLFPGPVTEMADGHLMIDYGKLTPLLIQSIQDLVNELVVEDSAQ